MWLEKYGLLEVTLNSGQGGGWLLAWSRAVWQDTIIDLSVMRFEDLSAFHDVGFGGPKTGAKVVWGFERV